MRCLPPLSTQKLVSYHLEDFSDTMGGVIEGHDLNVDPSGAEDTHHGSPLRDLFLQQHPVANSPVHRQIAYGQGNLMIPKKRLMTHTHTSKVIHILPSVINLRFNPVYIKETISYERTVFKN